MTLLERLCKADAEHFETGLPESALPMPNVLFKGIGSFNRYKTLDWEIAGYCLERMQERRKEVPSLIWLEELGWKDGIERLTPESIIEAYCQFKESQKEAT